MQFMPALARRARFSAALAALIALSALAGCSLFRAYPLVGSWRTDAFDVNGLKLPVGPEMTFTRDTVLVGGETLPIDHVDTAGDNVTVYLRSGVGLSFVMEGRDHMHFVMPVIGSAIHYTRR
jgi:hypothetical protein